MRTLKDVDKVTYPPIYKFGIISVRERETQQFHNAFSIIVLVTVLVLFLVSGSDMLVVWGVGINIIDS